MATTGSFANFSHDRTNKFGHEGTARLQHGMEPQTLPNKQCGLRDCCRMSEGGTSLVWLGRVRRVMHGTRNACGEIKNELLWNKSP